MALRRRAGLFEDGIVGRVVDHVQQPSVADAYSLRGAQAAPWPWPPPDQGGRDSEARHKPFSYEAADLECGYVRHGVRVKNAAGWAASEAARYAAALRSPSCAASQPRATAI